MLRFVVVRGVLMWGICTAVIFTAIQVLQHHEVGTLDVARNIGTFMVGGIFWGATMWWLSGRKKGKS
ncbi:hypothetical protein [Paraburkholderia antibiotica]|uniref:Uncharacterized protein n=1 Tax=Paraburkholderia antibiotica TaxID=2728839 RepID=A0A7Y0A2X2_9BURK|nr:hypothetical protein [Paraburkholderia antibiotica]NML35528.1 hypothetical protein [Paraburkholderia antibiotica]